MTGTWMLRYHKHGYCDCKESEDNGFTSSILEVPLLFIEMSLVENDCMCCNSTDVSMLIYQLNSVSWLKRNDQWCGGWSPLITKDKVSNIIPIVPSMQIRNHRSAFSGIMEDHGHTATPQQSQNMTDTPTHMHMTHTHTYVVDYLWDWETYGHMQSTASQVSHNSKPIVAVSIYCVIFKAKIPSNLSSNRAQSRRSHPPSWE